MKFVTILNGHPEYNLVNRASNGVPQFAYYVESADNLTDYNPVGYICDGGSSDYYPTNRSALHLGARIGDKFFIQCKVFLHREIQ